MASAIRPQLSSTTPTMSCGPQVLADEAARHQRHQQRPQAAGDRIGVAEIAVGIGLQQERVIERRGSSTESARYFHAAGSIDGRNGTATSPISVPVVMITPKVASRSDGRTSACAFHDACIRRGQQQQPDDQGFDDQFVSSLSCGRHITVTVRQGGYEVFEASCRRPSRPLIGASMRKRRPSGAWTSRDWPSTSAKARFIRSVPKPLRRGGADERAAGLLPLELEAPLAVLAAIGLPGDARPARAARQRAVLRGVGGELVQHQAERHDGRRRHLEGLAGDLDRFGRPRTAPRCGA